MDTFLPKHGVVTEDYNQQKKTQNFKADSDEGSATGMELNFKQVRSPHQNSSTSTKEQSEIGSASMSSGKQSQKYDSSEENQSDKKLEQKSLKKLNTGVATQDYSESRMEQERALVKFAESFKYFDRNDDFKTDAAYKKGGFPLRDKDITKRLRSSGTEVVKMIG